MTDPSLQTFFSNRSNPLVRQLVSSLSQKRVVQTQNKPRPLTKSYNSKLVITDKFYFDIEQKKKETYRPSHFDIKLDPDQVKFQQLEKHFCKEYYKPVTKLSIATTSSQIDTISSNNLISPKRSYFGITNICKPKRIAPIRPIASETQVQTPTQQTTCRTRKILSFKEEEAKNNILQLFNDQQMNSQQLELICKAMYRKKKKITPALKLFDCQSPLLSPRRFGSEIPGRQISEYIASKKPELYQKEKYQTIKSILNEYKKIDMIQRDDEQLIEKGPFQARLQQIHDDKLSSLKPLQRTFDDIIKPKETRKLEKASTVINNLSQVNMDLISREIDQLLEKWSKQIKVEIPKQEQDPEKKESEWAGFGIVFQEEEEEEKRNMTLNKIEKYIHDCKLIKQLEQENPPLYLQNIPKIMKQCNFSRYEVHNMYILYKVIKIFIL